MPRLQHKVAIVTGAGQGIGAAIARRFAEEGAVVVGIDRNPEPMAALFKSLTNSRHDVFDITDHAALERCIAETADRYGRIDILVNNAAVAAYIEAKDLPLEEWRRMLQVNLEAAFVAAQLVSRHMIAAKSGRIVNVASTQAIASEKTVGAYAASKGGMLAFTRTLAVELAPYDILVNAVAPGCIHTPMSFVNGVDETTTEYFQEWYVRRRRIPLGRPGEPEEVAGAVLFLASDDCRYMTGSTLVVDGGLTITF